MLSISFLTAIVAISCGRSVDLGGKHNDEEDGGAAGHDDGTGGFSGVGSAGNSFGGTAGDASAGTAGDGIAGAGLGGNSFGGTAGDASAGTAGDGIAGAGLGGNSFGGTAGVNINGGAAGVSTAGQAGIQEGPGLPTCIADLYAGCWPEGPCVYDEADATRCFASGAKIVTELFTTPCPASVTSYYKPDGSLCFSYRTAGNTSPSCEDIATTWHDANGTTVASAVFMGLGFVYSCTSRPTIPCNPSTDRCVFREPSCTPGECN